MAETALKNIKDPENPADSFGIAISSSIVDVPAGYTTTTVHSFDGKTARGTNSYTDKNQQAFCRQSKVF